MTVRISRVSDKDHIKKVTDKIKKNDGYCPCRLIKTADSLCICKEFREQKEGLCHCRLYKKEIINDINDTEYTI